VIRLALALTRGHFRKHVLEAALCIIGVALGVAVAVGIDGAVSASVASFRGAVESVSGSATHSISADTGTLTDEQYIELARVHHPWPMTPVIDRRMTALDGDDRPHVVHLLGIDPFADSQMRPFTVFDPQKDQKAFRAFYTEPDTVVLADELADALHAHVGSEVRLNVGNRIQTVRMVAIADITGPFRAQLEDLVIADLSTAQELANCVGQIDRVDLRLTAGQDAAAAAGLPKGLRLHSVSDRANQLEQLIAAYRLNLNALSLMASFVAIFIVYNAMLVSVQQRIRTLAVLRCLGSSRAQLGSIYLIEALAFSAAGAVLGILGGWGLCAAMMGYVGGTINDLYAAIRPPAATLTNAMILKGGIIALASGLIGAGIPLWLATQTPPITSLRPSAQRSRSRRTAWLLLPLAGACLGVTPLLNRLPGNSPTVGFVMALLTAIGFAMLCPIATWTIATLIGGIGRALRAVSVQMAAAGVAHGLRVTGVAVAAMMLAMAMNVALLTMVASFRSAVLQWLDHRFQSDVFIGPELQIDYHIDATLDPQVVRWVSEQPETAERLLYRRRPLELEGVSTSLVSTEVATLLEKDSLPFRSAPPTGQKFDPRHDLLLSEPLAGKIKAHQGDAITLDTPSGPARFKVFAIYFDFASDRGEALLDRSEYIRLWKDDGVGALHVRLRHPAQVHEVVTRWAAELEPKYPVLVHDYAHVKGETARIFDRTFRVTDVLGWMAGGVAFCGLAGALLSLSMARRQEYGVLSAIGMSGIQTAFWVAFEGIIIALVASLLASAAGTALAYLLAYVIQYRSFGWSIPMQTQPALWGEALSWSLIAALFAAIYPIYRLRRDPPARSLRQE
jgi:putative ABC transport system permease protein